MFKILLVGCLMLPFSVSLAAELTSLKEDGIHDANGPGFSKLQEPKEALGDFPKRTDGTVNWVKALDQKLISPRSNKVGDGKMTSVDLDLVLKNTGSMPYVLFSHKVHTQILTCANCHVEIFLPKQGSNFINMNNIMAGEQCGVCHGAVAFGVQNCTECHNVPSKKSNLR